MSSIQGPVICPATVHSKQTRAYTLPVNGPSMKNRVLRSGFWGFKGFSGSRINVNNQQRFQKGKVVKCSFSSSSNGNGSTAENFNENDADYVNSSVVEAGELLVGCMHAYHLNRISPLLLHIKLDLNLYSIILLMVCTGSCFLTILSTSYCNVESCLCFTSERNF